MLKNFLQRLLPKQHRPSQQLDGFTLLELLVAMVISSLVVGSLLTFVVGLLDSDRKEQSKSTTQNENQAALDYIADDLQEAIYIYDSDGLTVDTSTTVPVALPSGIKDQLPYGSDPKMTPILAFWKRNYLKVGETARIANTSLSGGDVTGSGTTKYRYTECLGTPPGTVTLDAGTGKPTNCFGTDQFVYSFVVYYLMNDGSNPWSKSARIGRWELKDGVKDTDATCTTTGTTCLGIQRSVAADFAIDKNYYHVLPDQGFQRFDVSKPGDKLADKMNLWRNSTGNGSTAYDLNANPITVLVDYLDDTSYATNQDDGSNSGLVQIAIGSGITANSSSNKNENNDCVNPAKGGTGPNSQRVPSTFSTTTSGSPAANLSSFYACVNSFGDRPVARVYIRGNALARLRSAKSERCLQNDTDTTCTGKFPNSDTYLPTSDVRVYGRGLLSPK